MDIVYDAEKSESNIVKHGISLAEAAQFEWDDALTWSDDRKNYGEVRMCALGYIGLRLYYVVYALRDNSCRVISLRKANPREVKRYAKA